MRVWTGTGSFGVKHRQSVAAKDVVMGALEAFLLRLVVVVLAPVVEAAAAAAFRLTEEGAGGGGGSIVSSRVYGLLEPFFR